MGWSKLTLIAGAAVTGLLACAPPPPPGALWIERGPPRDRVEVVAVRPGRDYVWIRGHWRWTGSDYDWVGGRWAALEGHRGWEEGRWVHKKRGWFYLEGRWR